MDTEGANLFKLIAKHRDPHQVCAIIDVCPKTTGFENVRFKIFDYFMRGEFILV
jgi:hypothetical protein